ncbi:MAG: hypothetical protein U9N40_07365 [Euryarchaeota archaeon]|nr:hypothetical protein [Euryarchaeota archaeon]
MKTKKGMRALSVILMLLLVSTAAVSAGNVLDNKKTIENNYLSVDMAYCIANATFADFMSSGALPEEEFQNAVVNRVPLIIYDINGLKLYYQFNLEIDGENVGFIRAAASKVSGCTVTMVQDHPDATDYELAEENSKNILITKYGVVALSSPKVVCYSYPKTGIMFETINSDGNLKRIILDAHDYSIIPERKPAFKGDAGIWSVYDDIEFDSIQNRLSKWDENVKTIDFYNDKSSIADITARSTFNYRKIWNNNNLVAQPNRFWCCVASGKMIAEWFSSSHTLDYIAGEMDAGTAQNPKGATTPGELDYYEDSPTGLNRNVQYYNDAGLVTWNRAYDHIQTKSDPLTSSVPAHERVCAGWGQYTSGEQYLYIFDPGPINVGSTYWENWDSVTHTEYILVD